MTAAQERGPPEQNPPDAMKNFRFCSFFVLATALVALAASLIVPGKGIPEASLGATRAQVEAKLGPPQDLDRNEFRPSDVYALYYSRGIELVYTNDRVSMITLHPADKQWKPYAGATREGLSVLSKPADVPKMMGQPSAARDGVLNYAKLGLVVQIKNNRIDSLILRPPGA